MKNFKYFKLGQQSSGQTMYGLYQLSLDCFLVMDESLALIKKLKFLLSSRYVTIIVQISDAENFTPTLIDNEVCEKWTLANKNDLSSGDVVYNGFAKSPMISVKQLIEKTNHFEWDILKEKQWIQMCMFYILFLDILKNKSYGELDIELSDYLLLDGIGDYLPIELMKKIMNILYFGQDIDSADQEIIQIIKNDHDLLESYQGYYNGYQCLT